MATSAGGLISGLQSFAHVQAPRLARPPGCSRRFIAEERPGRLHHASLGWFPAPRCGIATCVNEQFTRLDFHQLDCSLVGCSPPLRCPIRERNFSRGAWRWPPGRRVLSFEPMARKTAARRPPPRFWPYPILNQWITSFFHPNLEMMFQLSPAPRKPWPHSRMKLCHPQMAGIARVLRNSLVRYSAVQPLSVVFSRATEQG